MNTLSKTAIITSIISLVGLLLVILSGVAHPNPLFNYGAGLSIILLWISLALYGIQWVVSLRNAIAKKNTPIIVILIFAAILFVYPFLK